MKTHFLSTDSQFTWDTSKELHFVLNCSIVALAEHVNICLSLNIFDASNWFYFSASLYLAPSSSHQSRTFKVERPEYK